VDLAKLIQWGFMSEENKSSVQLGRPSKYEERFCQMLTEHMASGLSYLSFAAIIDVHEDTLYEWEKVHPNFSEAKKKGFSRNRLFWEKLGVDYITHTDSKIGDSSPKLNSSVYIFNMKNRFPKEWREKIELSGDTEKPLAITLNYDRKKKPKLEQ
jgi:hypothetical protein